VNSLRNLQPSQLWEYFEQLCTIPRASKHEDRIINYLIDFAVQNNLEYQKDVIGNLLIKKQASPSRKHSATLVLQSHVDMVCEKNSATRHDFTIDPIQPYIDGEWVKAKGTTLGADDGIGVAAMMAILADPTLEHGPLECLFTVDEESGLTGAFELLPDFFMGKSLINLDSEDEGELFIGCAGGMDTVAKFKYSPQAVDNSECIAFLVSITGLRGGHSGDDIHRGLGNAIKIMTDFLWKVVSEFNASLNRFEGGNLRNAIPREAFATVMIPMTFEDSFLNCLKDYSETMQQIYKSEPLVIIADVIPVPETKLSANFQHQLLHAIRECPQGVIGWSTEIEGFVETSTNLASIKFVNNEVSITTSQRSAITKAKQNIANKVASVFYNAGATIRHSVGYPGWIPNINSPLLTMCSKIYFQLFNNHPQVKAIHAGLECGLFLEKYPGLDMISFGPTIKGAHSPDERLHIASVTKFWNLLTEAIKHFK
jgi:dipeptidase D